METAFPHLPFCYHHKKSKKDQVDSGVLEPNQENLEDLDSISSQFLDLKYVLGGLACMHLSDIGSNVQPFLLHSSHSVH